MSRSKELVANCDGCGHEGALKHPVRHEHLCPRCGNIYDSGDLAELHLRRLLDPVVSAWRAHWLARGVEPGYLNELLNELGDVSNAPLQYRET